MNTTKIAMVVIVVAMIVLLAFSLYNSGKERMNRAEVIRVGTLEGGISTLDVMEEAGLYEKAGFKLIVVRLQKTPQLLSALLRNDLDIAVVPVEMAGRILEDNGSIVIIDTDMLQNQAIIFRKSCSPKALSGRTVGALLASGTYKIFKAYMKALYNLSVVENGTAGPGQIKAVNVYPGAFLAALERGDVDAVVAWEPFVSKALNNMNETCIVSYEELWRQTGLKGDPVMLVWIANRDFAEKHPDLIDKFLEARRLSAEYWIEHPDETKRILMKLYGLTSLEASALYDRVKITTEPLVNYTDSIREVWRLAWMGGYLERDPRIINGDAFWKR